MEINKIYNEDCLEGMKRIPDKSVDMILCDLPYGIIDCKWDNVIPFEPLWEQYNRIIKEHCAIVLFAQEPFASRLRMSNIKMYKYDWVWQKNIAPNFLNANVQPLKNHELICVFGKGKILYKPIMTEGKPYVKKQKMQKKEASVYDSYKAISVVNNGIRYPKTIQVFSVVTKSKLLNPTQKPVELAEYLIKTYTNEGALVLDNCMGSGTTAVACINTNRNYIGFELDEHYYNVACERVVRVRCSHC